MQLKTVFLALVVLFALLSCAAGKKHGTKKQKRFLLHKAKGHKKDKVIMKRHASPRDVNAEGIQHQNALPGEFPPKRSPSTSKVNQDGSPNELGNNNLGPNEPVVPNRPTQVDPPNQIGTNLEEGNTTALPDPPDQGGDPNGLGNGNPSPTGNTTSGTDVETEPSTAGGLSTQELTTPPPPANGLLDVGEIRAVSVSEICNGLLIDSQIVLTSASCVFPDYKSPEYGNITFTLNDVARQVVKVFANRDWRVDGQRKTNFALVKLGQPMTGMKASHPIELTWSPYALEDIGESFLATPAPTSCQTASKKARRTDEVRYLNDEVITADCHDRGAALAGSPMFRDVSGQPVVYGVHFGHCTTGALDRRITGSCGARITKNVFREFCQFADQELIQLAGCTSSALLHLLTEDLPTTVYDNPTYAAISSTVTNPKGAVFVYHSSNASNWGNMVNDIEAIQRTKVVYDKFQVAIVDLETLPYKVEAIPYIEYRSVGSKTYLPYTADYDFEKFKQFMVSFSTIGAPPTSSTNFLQHLNLNVEKRSSNGRADGGEFPNVQASRINNAIVIPESTKRSSLTCHEKAFLIKDEPTDRCHCMPGYFGSGTDCQNLTEAVTDNCRFDVSDTTQLTLTQIKQRVADSAWCDTEELILGYFDNDVESVTVAGDTLDTLDCIDEISELIRCPKSPTFMADSKSSLHAKHNKSHSFQRDRRGVFSAEDMELALLDRPRRTVTSTATVPVPANYLSSFLDNGPPHPTPYPSTNSYFIYQDWHPAAPNKYSTLYFGDQGIPEYTGYWLSHADLDSLSTGATFRRNAVSNTWHIGPGISLQGSDYFYKNAQPSLTTLKHLRVDKGHLNPVGINSYNKDNIRSTFIYTNACPQYYSFNRGLWRSFEGKIRNYAKIDCRGKDPASKFHLVTGVSDVEISISATPTGYTALRYPSPDKWPSLASAPISSTLVAIVIPRSMWTVGCCTWADASGVQKAESVSVWANNVHKLSSKTKIPIQPDLSTLARELYPTAGPSCFKFFPANSECDKVANHHML